VAWCLTMSASFFGSLEAMKYDSYHLVDFGEGRKLERFGDHLLSRPCPAAENVQPAYPPAWPAAEASFHRRIGSNGRWQGSLDTETSWIIRLSQLQLELKLTPFGHVGLFPEHTQHWNWLARCLELGRSKTSPPANILNLFAYTGASTLAAAAAGAMVTHVDGARNIVKWARRNAELSKLGQAPVRWIAEDVRKFVARELRRGSRYDGLIVDPPSYGRGPRGQLWKLDEHLPDLLAHCHQLIEPSPRLLLISCHSSGWDATRLRSLVREAMPSLDPNQIDAREVRLASEHGAELSAGHAVRWPSE